MIATEKEKQDAVLKALMEGCPSAIINFDDKAMLQAAPEEPAKVAQEVCEKVKEMMLPKAYVLVMPAGEIGFGDLVTTCICTTTKGGKEGARPQKFTVIDTTEIFEPGRHSPEIEDRLHKALFTAEAPDCLPAKLWVDLFQEAFSTSATPMGPFLITNFPTASALTGNGPAIRDQFCMLDSIVVLGGILHVTLREDAFNACCPDRTLDFDDQQQFDFKVKDQILKQYNEKRLCEALIETIPNGAEKAAEKVCAQFLTFLDTDAAAK